MSSFLPTTGILGASLGLPTEGILGSSLLSDETPRTVAHAEVGTGTWLLDLDVAGQVLRYSTRDVVVSDTRGIRYVYRSGLGAFSMSLDGLQESQGLAVTDRGVDWALLARRGANLGRARGVLRYWEPGDLLEGAMVVLAGDLADPEYGDPDQPARLTGTLRAGAARDRIYPPEQAAITTSTWSRSPAPGSTYDDVGEGMPYPTVFGYPGEDDEVVDPPVPVVPGVLVEQDPAALAPDALLLGYGALDCVGGEVFVRHIEATDSGWAEEWCEVVARTDLLGQTVTVAVLEEGAGAYGSLGHTYYVGYSRASGKGGGSLRPDRTGPIETLTDVALFVLRNSGREVDLQAQEAERGRLDRYRIDGMLSERVELVPWFEGEILPMFPITRARTQRGIYWRFLNWWAGKTDAVMILDADRREVQRASSIREPEGAILNHFTIDYQLGGYGGAARRTLTAEYGRPLPWFEHPDLLPDARVIGSPILARSQSVYGVREADPVVTEWVWKSTTAAQILQHLAVRDAFPRRPVSYTGDARRLRCLSRGDIVLVTDSAVHLDEAVAMVASVELGTGRLATVSLELLDPRRL